MLIGLGMAGCLAVSIVGNTCIHNKDRSGTIESRMSTFLNGVVTMTFLQFLLFEFAITQLL
jgi:hypothetical protein